MKSFFKSQYVDLATISFKSSWDTVVLGHQWKCFNDIQSTVCVSPLPSPYPIQSCFFILPPILRENKMLNTIQHGIIRGRGGIAPGKLMCIWTSVPTPLKMIIDFKAKFLSKSLINLKSQQKIQLQERLK